jgi:hypothetical protein
MSRGPVFGDFCWNISPLVVLPREEYNLLQNALKSLHCIVGRQLRLFALMNPRILARYESMSLAESVVTWDLNHETYALLFF